MLNKKTNFSPHTKNNDGGLISLIKNRINLLILSSILLCFLFVFGGVKAEALVANDRLDITLSDSLDFVLNPEETSSYATLVGKNNNNNNFVDVYIDKIEILSKNEYSLVPNTDFTKEVDSKKYAILLNDNNNQIDLSNPLTQRKDLRDYNYELKTSVQTSTISKECADIVYTISTIQNTYNISYNLDGGTLPLKKDKTYIYQDITNPYGDDYEVQYGTIDLTGVEEVAVSLPSQYMEQIKLYIDEEPFDVINEYGKDEFRITIPDRYKKQCNVWLFYYGDDWYTPGIYTYIADAPRTYTVAEGVSTLPTPTKDGYQFKGWNKKIPYSYYSENNTWKTDGTNYWTNGSEKNTKVPPITALAPMLSFEFELKTRGNLSFFITNPAVQGKENQVKIYKDNHLIKEIYLFEDRGYYGNSKEVNVNELLTEGRYKVEILQYYADTLVTNGKTRVENFSILSPISSIPKGTTGDITLTADWVVEPFLKSGPEFNKLIPTGTTAIEFVDTKAPSNASLIDLSRDNNMTVVGWLDSANGTFYVSTQKSGIKAIAHQDCSKMFCGAVYGGNETLRDVNSIKFNNLIDTLNTINMSETFSYTGFNTTTFIIQDLDNWNVSSVTDMSEMFTFTARKSKDFNINGLDNWNVSNVINMSNMFQEAGQQAEVWSIGDLSNWNVSNVMNMSEMFYQAGEYTTNWSIGDLSNWNVGNVTNMYYMFCNAGSNSNTWSIGDISSWNVSNVTDMGSMFNGAGAKATIWNIGNLNNWNVSNVTNMGSMFNGAGKNATTWLIGDLSNWDTSKATKMRYMFSSAGSNATNAINCGITIMNPNTDVGSMFTNSFLINSARFLVYDNGDDGTFNKAEKAVATKPMNSKVYHVRDINYNVNGGTMPSSYEKTYIGDKEVTLPSPTKSGVGFVGWHLKEDLSDAAIMKLPTNLTGKINVYAEYESPYNINYNLDGGTLPSNAPKTYCSSQGLDILPTPTKSGYKFIGWKKQTKVFDEGHTVPTNGKGQVSEKTFTFNANEGDKLSFGYIAVDLSYTGSLSTIELNGVKVVEKHSNLGYGTEMEFVEFDLIKGVNTITFTFNEGGGIGTSGGTSNYIDMSINWTNGFIKSSTAISKIDIGTTGDITLTAEWEEVTTILDVNEFRNAFKDVWQTYNTSDNPITDVIVTDASQTFDEYDLKYNATTVSGSNGVIYIYNPYGTSTIYITGNGKGVKAPVDSSYMFDTLMYVNLNSLDLRNLDVSDTVNMQCMLTSCYAQTVYTQGWDTSKVEDMSMMIDETHSSEIQGMEDWDTSSVLDMSYMLYNARNLNGRLKVLNPNTNLSGFVSSFESQYGFYIDYTKDTKNIVETELANGYTCAQLGKEL